MANLNKYLLIGLTALRTSVLPAIVIMGVYYATQRGTCTDIVKSFVIAWGIMFVIFVTIDYIRTHRSTANEQ